MLVVAIPSALSASLPCDAAYCCEINRRVPACSNQAAGWTAAQICCEGKDPHGNAVWVLAALLRA
eukprot:3244997-Alexandrium_andersonii.AAC.1